MIIEERLKELICKNCHRYFDKEKIHYKNSSGDIFCSKKCAMQDLEKIDINKHKFADWMCYDDD